MTALAWLAWFALYLSGLSPSLGGEDSGEFATVAATLGMPHAPGYPVYALAGRLAAALPLGSVAFRLNLFSAAAAAGACAFLFMLASRVARMRFGLGKAGAAACGAVASLSMGLTHACWYQAGISDKYPLNLLFLAALTCGMLSRWSLPGLALLLGLSFAHHLQTLYVVPGLAWIAWRVARPTPRAAAACALLFVAGISPKLVYPPVRAAAGPALMIEKPATFLAHARYLRAAAYSGKIAGPSRAALWRDAAMTLAGEASIGVLAGPAGLLAWSARAGGTAVAAWLTAAAGFGVAASLDLTGREFYLLPVAWLLAFGTGCLLARGLSSVSRAGPGRVWAAAIALATAVPVVLAVRNAPLAGRGRISVELDYGRNLLAGLPPRAVFFASGDDVIYPSFYLRIVEAFRTDVVVIPDGFLSRPFARGAIARELPGVACLSRPAWIQDEIAWSREVTAECLRGGRPVALVNPSREGISLGLRRGIRDLVYEVYRDRPAMRPGPALWLRTRGWHHDPRGLTVRQGWTISLYGKYQRQYADELANAGMPAESLPRFRRALAVADLPDREGAVNNHALALERAGRPDDALAAWGRLMAAGTRRPEVWLNAGNLLLALGRREEARRAYEAAVALAEPGSPHAGYARRQLGRLGGGG